MATIADSQVYELKDFLDNELFLFVLDSKVDTPTSNNVAPVGFPTQTNITETEIDEMFLQAFEELDDKSMLKLQEAVIPATKKDRHAAAVSQLSDQSAMAGNRPFAKPVSSKDIEQVIKSAVPETMQQDNKYCAKLWHDWVSYRRKATNVIIPPLHNITSTELQHWNNGSTLPKSVKFLVFDCFSQKIAPRGATIAFHFNSVLPKY